MTTLIDIEQMAVNMIKTVEGHSPTHGRLMTASELGYTFAWGNRKRAGGTCNYLKKVITLERPLTIANLDNVHIIKNTILHEIAHALVGRGHGHDWVWKQTAMSIGCDGARCMSEETNGLTESKYTLSCSSCGKVTLAHRRPKYDKSCGRCSGGRYNGNYKLELTQNY